MGHCKRCKELEAIILDIHWLARRYADGRQSYAPGMFNRAMDKALELGLPLKEDSALGATFYATDGQLGDWIKGQFIRSKLNLLSDIG